MQRDSNPQPLSLQTKTQSISQSVQTAWLKWLFYELGGCGFESVGVT